MRKIEPEFITGMGYIGASPGVLYRMGGAGEQTVVTGNPALLENVKGSRFTSLTLHGKSTQMNTTGAQLLPFEVGKKGINFEVFEDGIVISCKKGTDIYAVGRPDPTLESSYDDFPLLAPGEYYIYSDGKYVELLVTTFVNGKYLILGVSKNGSAIKIKVIAGYKFRILIRCREDFDGKVKAIISKRYPTASNYEPYTGGKPSPSQEYPQEIKSVGQDGEIGVEVLGKNLIPFPYPILGGAGTQIERGGVKYTVQSDGGIRCVGTPTAVGYINLSRIKFSDVGLTATHPTDGKIVLSGEKMAYDPSNHALFIYITSDQLGKPIDTVIYPQIEFGTVATEYEPYKPAQTLIIPTPNGLPGIPVSSDGNYTDADGRQWVCDEVDFKKGVYVQRIGKRTITSKDVFHKSGMSTDDVNYFSLGNFSLHIGTIGEKDVLMSNCFVAGINHGFGAWGKIFLSSAFDGKVYFSVEAQKYPDEETFKQWAVENGLMFLYQLVDIIETPLAAEELSAYKTLRTYSPTTTVINDAGAGMSVGYKRRK